MPPLENLRVCASRYVESTYPSRAVTGCIVSHLPGLAVDDPLNLHLNGMLMNTSGLRMVSGLDSLVWSFKVMGEGVRLDVLGARSIG